MLVLALLVTAVVLVVAGAPTRTVREAAGGVQGWSGVTYRGQIVDAGAPAVVELTVDNQGNGVGSITRSVGGRADIVITPSTQAIRGDAAWWQRSAPRPSLVVRLADRWVSGVGDQLADVSGWTMTPAALSGSLTGQRTWSGAGDEQIGGAAADAYVDGSDRALVDSSGPQSRLVGVDLGSFAGQRTSPVAVEQAGPDAVGRVGTALAQVPTMPDYFATINEPAHLAPTWVQTQSPCTTDTCTDNVTVVNQGQWSASGTAKFSVNDQVLASQPFTVAAGASVTFPMSFRNIAPPTGQVVTVRTRVDLVDVE